MVTQPNHPPTNETTITNLTNEQKWQLWQHEERTRELQNDPNWSDVSGEKTPGLPGKKLQVKDVMGHHVITCHQDRTVKEAAELMAKNRIGVIPVEDDQGSLIGIFSDCDFVGRKEDFPRVLAEVKTLFGQMFYDQEVEKLFYQAKDKTLREVMNFDPITIAPDATVSEAVNLLGNKQLSGIPVTEDGRIVGIFTRQDVVHAFLNIVNSCEAPPSTTELGLNKD